MPTSLQVDQFVSETEAATKDLPKLPPDTPKVPFQTALRLTGDQEKKMLDHAFNLMARLSSDNGRDSIINPTWWANLAPAPAMPTIALASQGLWPPETFLGKRARFDATFYNDVSWRPFVMQGIFESSNLCVPLSRRICSQMIARAKDAFFGSDPWFSIEPLPEPSQEIDEQLALRIERFAKFKMIESNSKADKERALGRAMVLGECPVKTSYVVRDQMFNVEAMVLVDVEDKQLVGQDGNVITDQDKTEPNDDGTKLILSRDQITEMPTAPIFKKQMLKRRQVLFEGARSEPIFYKDFLCPLNAADVQSAEGIIHLYDKPVAEFVDLVVKRGMVSDDTSARLDAVQKMSYVVKEISANSAQPKSALTQELRPNENFSPQPVQGEVGPIAEFAEFYMWYDANNDGIAENIMLIADRRTRMPIFYDHVANVTTDGLRPIEIIRIKPIEGRWYGQGIMEYFESYQTVVDLMVNRWNFSQSRSGRIDLWDPTATLEGEANPNIKINWGGTYTKKPGKKKEDILESVYLNDTKFEALQTMTQFFTQLAMNESGVANANDNYVAGMEQAKLATGIQEIAKSGDELFKPILSDLTGPMERLLTREIDVLLANMDPEEVYTYLEGDTMGVDKLTAEDVRGLKFRIRIELTRHKNQQNFASAKSAADLIEKFYMLPPQIQQYVAPFYRKQLRALDPHCDADHAIVAGVAQILPNGTPPNGMQPPTYQGDAPQPAGAASA